LWTGQDFGDMLPSEVFNRSVLTCFIDDHFGLASTEFLDMDNVMWECDYPHSDSTWPNSPEMLMEELVASECTDEEIDKITFGNAARFFEWDPFAHIPREQATVGALRARATDVDISETSKSEYRRRYELANS
ncbi:MAG: amidohydrolase family protein, partial [Rhodococcus sp. (in: high G+C Gram-positive bacteria)]|uniref:amidohydrolase family protein n=1 Tax=Rhodococcus sp. TaxID=1831 RepID=UPI003D9BC9D7